jgi:hypothetical protein
MWSTKSDINSNSHHGVVTEYVLFPVGTTTMSVAQPT